MRKMASFFFLVCLALAQTVLAHDPRTVAKDFTHSLSVEGAGKLTLSYKSLHWNEPTYNAAKANDQLRTRLNGMWKKIGKFDADFDLSIGGVQVPKGSYSLGVGFDGKDNFSLVLGGGGSDITIPLQTAADSPMVSYLSFDIRPASDTDTFVIEGRSGKFRSWAELKVPYLAAHEHADKKP